MKSILSRIRRIDKELSSLPFSEVAPFWRTILLNKKLDLVLEYIRLKEAKPKKKGKSCLR